MDSAYTLALGKGRGQQGFVATAAGVLGPTIAELRAAPVAAPAGSLGLGLDEVGLPFFTLPRPCSALDDK